MTVSTGLVLVLLLVPRAQVRPEQEAAEKSARAWLALVDEGKYDQSWEQAAELFRGAVTKEDWAKAMNGSRKPLGRLLSRKLKSATYAESLPGAPDGKYVVLQFDTSFENKKSAVETVTPMLERDGAWRVSGYFIK